MTAVKSISERGLHLGKWSNLVSALFIEHTSILELMPDEFQLVTLPQEEPELIDHALSLAPTESGIPCVYAWISHETVTFLLPQGPIQVKLEPA
jgi:hypothetical protein